VTNTPLYDHIYRMRTGTAIAFGITVALFALLGLQTSGSVPGGQIVEIQSAVASSYSLSLLAFLPLVLTFGLALRGYPALPTLVVGAIGGALTSVVVQGHGFVAAWEVFIGGTEPATGSELVNELLNVGGLTGSAWTITVVVAALSLGGLLERTGVLAVLAHHLSKGVGSSRGLIAGTGLSAIAINVLTAQQYMSIVLPGMTLRNLYDEFSLDSDELSRAVEAAGTPTGALIPWHAGGVYMASVTGVGTLEYAPFYLFGLLSPVVLFLMTLTGVGVPSTTRFDRPQHAD
ncbi:Na+/H+ antiporter NhaC family protein, partial [Natrialba asiatica]|uniref:Na+/H+ antiporter NhaC family protein n=1 Tax=Natrialba asiatica TaxID=64602 RepID=UPI0023A91CDE